jgi:hypothetical protein
MDEPDMWEKMVDDEMEAMRVRESIVCPWCSHVQDNETIYKHVSYWGADGWQFVSCGSCGENFEVLEIVVREFKSRKIDGVN